MNRILRYVAAGTFAVGAIGLLAPATLVAQMGQGGLDSPTTAEPPPAPPAMDDQPTTKPADEAGSTVESPYFRSWKGRGVGSSATLNVTVSQGGQATTGTMTLTLKEISEDRGVYVQSVKFANQGNADTEQPFVAKVPEKSKWQLPGDQMMWTPAGNEKLTVNGKEFDCTKLTMSMSANGSTLNGTLLYTPEIPGGIAKIEIEGSSQEGEGKITMVCSTFEVK